MFMEILRTISPSFTSISSISDTYGIIGSSSESSSVIQSRACLLYTSTWLLHLIRIDASFEEQELKWRVKIAWKSFGSEPKKEVTHGEENTDREETRKEQRVDSSRGLPKVEKESAEEKTIVESGQAASKDMEERSGKKTEKSPESILQKTHERPEKVQPEKNSEKPEKTDKIEKKEEKTGRFEKIKCTIVKFCDKIKHTVGHAEDCLLYTSRCV